MRARGYLLLQRNELVFAREMFVLAGTAVEHSGHAHRVDPRGALNDLGATARRDHHEATRFGRIVTAQSAVVVHSLAGEKRLEVELLHTALINFVSV